MKMFTMQPIEICIYVASKSHICSYYVYNYDNDLVTLF